MNGAVSGCLQVDYVDPGGPVDRQAADELGGVACGGRDAFEVSALEPYRGAVEDVDGWEEDEVPRGPDTSSPSAI
jgi:hypothetical protein